METGSVVGMVIALLGAVGATGLFQAWLTNYLKQRSDKAARSLTREEQLEARIEKQQAQILELSTKLAAVEQELKYYKPKDPR